MNGGAPDGEEQKLFYALLGQAVEDWSHVEDALCDVFVASIGIDLTDEDNCTVGAAGFYAVLSFEANLSMPSAQDSRISRSIRRLGDTRLTVFLNARPATFSNGWPLIPPRKWHERLRKRAGKAVIRDRARGS